MIADRSARQGMLVKAGQPPLQIWDTGKTQQLAQSHEREFDLALAWVPPQRRALGAEKTRARRLAVGRILDVDMGATAERSRLVDPAAAVVAEDRTGVTEPPTVELSLAIDRAAGIEGLRLLALLAGPLEQQRLKAPGLIDRALQSIAGMLRIANTQGPSHAQRFDGEDRREIGAAGRAARATAGIDGGRVQEQREVGVEGSVGPIEQRPHGLGHAVTQLTVCQSSLDQLLSLAQVSEDGPQLLLRVVAAACPVEILSTLRRGSAIVIGDDAEADHASA